MTEVRQGNHGELVISLEARARAFALECHGDQRYGAFPYSVHLAAVVEILRPLQNSTLIVAGWLHDTVEDAQVSVEAIARRFGEPVAMLVWAVTGVGRNRKERNRSAYYKIHKHPNGDAATLKLADRIANIRASKTVPHKLAMYRNEWPEFRAALFGLGAPELWKILSKEI